MPVIKDYQHDTDWGIDSWHDNTFEPSDMKVNMKKGLVPLNTNDFFGKGPGLLELHPGTRVLYENTSPLTKVKFELNLYASRR
jgi:hypothetical protein